VEIFLTQYMPQFWTQGAEIFWALRDSGDPLSFLNFRTLTLKLGRGETIVKVKKFTFYG